MISSKKIIMGIASVAFLADGVPPASAFFNIEGKTAGPVSIFSQGGLLDYNAQNNPYFMLGIEPKSDGVYLTQGNTLPCDDFKCPNTKTRLLKITGFGQTERIGPVLKAGVDAIWGNSLTTGPENKLYIATNQGVWGFDPLGGPLDRYSQWEGRVTAAGLTFDQNGQRALVSGDYTGLVYVNKGAVQQDTPLVGGVANVADGDVEEDPDVVSFDDHIVRSDGIYIIGDAERAIAKYIGLFKVKIEYNLKTDQDVAPVIQGTGYGSRGVVDPISGDIFYALTFFRKLPEKFYILRIKKDFSDATVFAKDMEQIRDLKFGPSSAKYGSGNLTSLYVAVNDRVTFQGTIYEIPMGKSGQTSLKMTSAKLKPMAVPEPRHMFGLATALAWLMWGRKFFSTKETLK